MRGPGGVTRLMPSLVRPATAALVVVLVAACGSARDAVSDDPATVTDGALTVAASLPSPGFWNGDTPDTVDGGFEWAIAAALAGRFGLELAVVDVPFDRIAAGDLGGADLAIAQIEITSERADVVDLSVPYYDVDMGVLVRQGTEVRDLAGARDLGWVTVRSAREETFVRDVIAPGAPVRVVDDEVAAAAEVAVEHSDAALVDLPSALVIAAEQPALDVAARFITGGQYAIALPTGSPNRELVDAALRGFRRDGTIDRLEREWLVPAFARPPGDVPVILTR